MRLPLSAAFLLLCLVLGVPAAASSEEIRLKMNGLTVNALWQDQGSSEVVLLLHGTLAHNDMDVIRGLRTALEEAGLSSMAINLSLDIDDRHGMYDCSQPHRHREEDALPELAAWIDWLKTEKGIESVVLLGHSRGGNQVAQKLATGPGETVVAGVLLAPSTWQRETAEDAYRSRFGVELGSVLKQAEELAAKGAPDSLMPDTGLLYCDPGQVSAASFLSYYRPDPSRDTPSLLPGIAVPVLVIAGSEDSVVQGLTEAMSAQTLKPGQQFAVVDGADHFFRDLFAYDVVDLIVAFLDERAPE